MKTSLNIVGYITALLLFSTAIIKMNYLPGGSVAMVLSGAAFSIYLPFFLLSRTNTPEDKEERKRNTIAAISASVINLAMVFKFQYWPGANIMFVLGLTCFAFIYLPLLLKHKLKSEGKERNTFMYTSGAIGLTFLSVGLLFKIMHWPGAAVMLGLSIIFLFIGYFLVYLLDRSISQEKKSDHLRNAFFVVIIGSMLTTFIVRSFNQQPREKNEKVVAEVKVM